MSDVKRSNYARFGIHVSEPGTLLIRDTNTEPTLYEHTIAGLGNGRYVLRIGPLDLYGSAVEMLSLRRVIGDKLLPPRRAAVTPTTEPIAVYLTDAEAAKLDSGDQEERGLVHFAARDVCMRLRRDVVVCHEERLIGIVYYDETGASYICPCVSVPQ